MKTDTAFARPPSFSGIRCLPLLALVFLLPLLISSKTILAQVSVSPNNPHTILFKGGHFTGNGNLKTPIPHPWEKDALKTLQQSLRPASFKNHAYVLIQLDSLPGKLEKQALEAKGIKLYDYLPGNAYLAETPDSFTLEDLKYLGSYSVKGIFPQPEAFKMAENLLRDNELKSHEPDHQIAVNYFGTLSPQEVAAALQQSGATLIPTKIQPKRTLFIQASNAVLQKIASLPFISYLALQPLKSIPLNYNNRAAHGLDALNAPSGRNLMGDGTVIGIGDDSDPYTHVDFTGRLIERFPATVNPHGTHTSGTLAGGGIADPMYRGMAPHATLVSQYFSDILVNAPVYLSDFNMTLTNNSYTAYNSGCNYNGQYDALSNYLDGQLAAYPGLLHVFAAGNDGRYVCSPYTAPYATIKSGYQVAKNVLTVGDMDDYNYVINVSSSVGPVDDGRLKPEIVAGGTNITSTLPYNNYGVESGTSMSSPTVTGTLALLQQRYQQLHGGAEPASALLKAVICNSATDLGNPGPDFVFGFGNLNARTAVESIENNQYFTGTLNNTGKTTFTLSSIPAGLQQLKIMLYWPDAPAAPFAATALVNNLDLTVNSPDGMVHHPLILNPDPAHVNDVAVEGIDNLNNIEQVVINNPPAGNFTITINGTSIPEGPQAFVVAYQTIKPSVTVEYPFGNETWVPGQQEIIRWNAYGGDTNPFTIEYSSNNGSTWTTISNAVPATSRMYAWTVPTAATGMGLIRVTRNGTTYSDISDYPFTILGQPYFNGSNPCQGYAQLNWSSVPSATGYEIMQLKGDTMSTVATTTATNFLLGPLNRDSTYWLAVRALNGTSPGRRSPAINITPTGGACGLPGLNNDLTLDSLIAPHSGRQFTSTQLNAATAIKVELKNLGTIPTASPISLNYQVNGGPIITESSSTVIGAGAVLNYTFSNTVDMSAPGAYDLQVWVAYPGDSQAGNDTIHVTINQLQNAPVVLSPTFMEGFETAGVVNCTTPTVGLPGLDHFDFNASNANGRVRTFINTGFARTGDRCAALDQVHFNGSATADSLTATFNMSNYSRADQVWLDFYYRNQGNDFSLPGNQVWIRGNDQAAWLPVYTLDSSAAMIGIYQPSASIDITGILAAANPVQTFSSSFQIRFGEQGYTSTNSVIPDGDLDDGYLFDDISLTRSSNDMAMRSLVSPALTGICNLGNAETISVLVRNYSATAATNIPVTYSINGVQVTENIPLINPFDSVVYQFTHTADLSAYQQYTLSAWVSNPGDNYHHNDTLPAITFQTTPLIATFPYLEGFESNNGYWYTNGINDSWQWGTPAKTIIKGAANGSKCWVTSLTGDYNNNEQSYLYSPCFDLSQLTNPVLSFSHIFQTEDDCMCDFHWVEYSTDGVNWQVLGTVGSGTNWYDFTAWYGKTERSSWQLSDTIWHVSSYDIPVRSSRVRFRISMSSDQATNYEGVAIDDVHIFDKTPIYSGPSVASGMQQTVSGRDWVDFKYNGSLVFSLNPNGQDLGNTQAAVYFHNGPARNDGRQYYLNRNIVIQPTNPPNGNVGVRYYFTDAEADSLIQGTGCDSCARVHDAYQAGIMQYSSPVLSEEDSILANDASGTFRYLPAHRDCSLVPYDNGYYAEYQVSGFSEFWINTGTPGPGQPLPLALLTFSAFKPGNEAVLQWSTTGEKNTSRYVIQKSADAAVFHSIDSVKATGDSAAIDNYHYFDTHIWDGTNYYRLKMVADDGSFRYSPIRSIYDSLNTLVVSLYPNPVRTGLLYISSSVNCESVRVTDVSGRLVLQAPIRGFQNTLPLEGLARGVYFVQVQTDAGSKVGKVLVL